MDQTIAHKPSSLLKTISIILMVMLLGAHAALIAAVYQRTTGQRVLAHQVESLRVNVEQLEQVLDQRGAETSSELAEAEIALESLRSSPPSLLVPDDVIDIAFNLSPLDAIQLNSVTRVSYSEREVPSGSIAIHTYRFHGSGPLSGCLSFIERLEAMGEPTLAIENVVIEPQAEACAFDALMMSPLSAR